MPDGRSRGNKMTVMSIVRRTGIPALVIGATLLAPSAAQAAAAPSQVSTAVSIAAPRWQLMPGQVNDCSNYALVSSTVRGLVPGRHYSFVSNDPGDLYTSVDPQPAVPVVADRSGSAAAVRYNAPNPVGKNCAAGWFLIDTGTATVRQYVQEGNPYRTVLRASTSVRTIRTDVLCAVDGCRQSLQSLDHRTTLPAVFTSHYNLVQQADGNLVLRHDGRAIWTTATAGNPGARLVLQSDGNLVVRSKAGTALWNSGTARAGRPTYLSLQDDGNVVLRDVRTLKVLWTTGTSGR